MLLTEREKIVLNLTLSGSTNAQIASELGIKVNTVKAYKARVTGKYRKFGFTGLPEIVRRFTIHRDHRLDFHQEIL